MSTTTNIRSRDLIRAWFATSTVTLRDIAMTALVCLGCTVAGLLTLRVPAHRSFHRATVRRIFGDFASKRPNILIEVETESGRRVLLSAVAYNPELREGAKLCVNEMKDTLRGGAIWALAPPWQCADLHTPAP